MFGWIKKRRRRRLAAQKFPGRWQEILERNVPYYKIMPPADQKELRSNILIFMGEKRFEGCGGLKLSEEIKVTIAAQACILLLHRRTDYYPGLASVLVYPHSYVAHHSESMGPGLVCEGPEVLRGESWRRGTIVLSWDDVRRDAEDIHDHHNVVYHEFAHQLDSSSGKGDNSPVLQRRSNYIAWARKLQKEYQRLRRDVARNRPHILDEYGADNPAEFFAVVTESFFQQPQQLQKLHPQLYREMKDFYQQDPALL